MSSFMHDLKLAAVAVTAAAALAACGGSSPHNAAPTVASIGDQSVDQDTPTAPLAVKVSDVETPADQLQITLATSDPAVIPMEGLKLEGSGASRTLTVTPAAGVTGSATVSLVVIDAAGASTTGSFKVTVKPVLAQFKALSDSLFAQDDSADPKRIDNVTFTFDADDDPAAFDMLLAQ